MVYGPPTLRSEDPAAHQWPAWAATVQSCPDWAARDEVPIKHGRPETPWGRFPTLGEQHAPGAISIRWALPQSVPNLNLRQEEPRSALCGGRIGANGDNIWVTNCCSEAHLLRPPNGAALASNLVRGQQTVTSLRRATGAATTSGRPLCGALVWCWPRTCPLRLWRDKSCDVDRTRGPPRCLQAGSRRSPGSGCARPQRTCVNKKLAPVRLGVVVKDKSFHRWRT